MSKILLVIDIDETVAQNEQRVHLLPNWKEFFHACDTDTPIEPMIKAIKPYLKDKNIDVIFLTGRSGYPQVKEKTELWLEKYGIKDQIIFYRKVNDYTKAPIFKQKMVEEYRKEEHSLVIIVDDDYKITDHFTHLGHKSILVKPDENYKNTIDLLNNTIKDFDINKNIKLKRKMK